MLGCSLSSYENVQSTRHFLEGVRGGTPDSSNDLRAHVPQLLLKSISTSYYEVSYGNSFEMSQLSRLKVSDATMRVKSVDILQALDRRLLFQRHTS
ncbi:MAG: hypothetical protein LBH38_04045 [Holosporales bacterium]|nr:hypothetical protein [Holosporales bacterium]